MNFIDGPHVKGCTWLQLAQSAHAPKTSGLNFARHAPTPSTNCQAVLDERFLQAPRAVALIPSATYSPQPKKMTMKIVAKHIAGVGTPGGYKLLDTLAKKAPEETRGCTNSSNLFTTLNTGEKQPRSTTRTPFEKLRALFKSDGAHTKKSSIGNGEDSVKKLYEDILNPNTKRIIKSANSVIEQANTFVRLPYPETARVLGYESSATAKEMISTALYDTTENLRELLETSDDPLAVRLTMSRSMTARISLKNVDFGAIPEITDISPPSVK